MRLQPLLVALLMPATTQAKGPSFGDLISELMLPARIQPGEAFAVVAKIDLVAFCARTTSFGGPSCVSDSNPGAWVQLVLVPTVATTETTSRIVDIQGRLDRGADGVYRGTMSTFPCQKAGQYHVQAQTPDPNVSGKQVEVASVAACIADVAAPRVTAVRLPERLKLPATPPADNTGWTHGKLIVEVDDDVSGALEMGYLLTPIDDASSNYGGATIPCEACGGHWSCSANIPLCVSAELGDLAVRVTWVTDRAGRQNGWSSVDDEPFAVIHCGGESSPEPTLACAAPSVDDAGMPRSRPSDAGPDATAVTESPATATDARPPSPPAGSGCAVASTARGPGSLLLTLVAGLAGALVRRRTRRAPPT